MSALTQGGQQVGAAAKRIGGSSPSVTLAPGAGAGADGEVGQGLGDVALADPDRAED